MSLKARCNNPRLAIVITNNTNGIEFLARILTLAQHLAGANMVSIWYYYGTDMVCIHSQYSPDIVNHLLPERNSYQVDVYHWRYHGDINIEKLQIISL